MNRRFLLLSGFILPSQVLAQPRIANAELILSLMGAISSGITILGAILSSLSRNDDPCPVHRARAQDIAHEVDYISNLVESIFLVPRGSNKSFLLEYAEDPSEANWMKLKDGILILSDRLERLLLWMERVFIRQMTPSELLRVRSALGQIAFFLDGFLVDSLHAKLSPSGARALATQNASILSRLKSETDVARASVSQYLARVRTFGVCG